jgi:hypothetical protein
MARQVVDDVGDGHHARGVAEQSTTCRPRKSSRQVAKAIKQFTAGRRR